MYANCAECMRSVWNLLFIPNLNGFKLTAACVNWLFIISSLKWLRGVFTHAGNMYELKRPTVVDAVKISKRKIEMKNKKHARRTHSVSDFCGHTIKSGLLIGRCELLLAIADYTNANAIECALQVSRFEGVQLLWYGCNTIYATICGTSNAQMAAKFKWLHLKRTSGTFQILRIRRKIFAFNFYWATTVFFPLVNTFPEVVRRGFESNSLEIGQKSSTPL